MIEIIKPSNPDKYETECYYCNALLRYDVLEEELVHTKNVGCYWKITCPACKKDIVTRDIYGQYREKVKNCEQCDESPSEGIFDRFERWAKKWF